MKNIESITHKILKIIEKNQTYLCESKNLPQLAKLIFLWDNLFYAGRICYGHDYKESKAVIKGKSWCENNPKYELEDHISYLCEEFENLIYDSWCVYVTMDKMIFSWIDIQKLFEPVELTEFEKLTNKKNKTYEELLEVCMNGEYKLIYPDEFSVKSHVLCGYGNGYSWNKDGFACSDGASGEDLDQYAGWQQAKLKLSIQKQVDKIFSLSEVIECLEKAKERNIKLYNERKEKDNQIIKELKEAEDMFLDTFEPKEKEDFLLRKKLRKEMYEEEEKKKYLENRTYRDMSEYSMFNNIPDNIHPSYLNACKTIADEIINSKKESKRNKQYARNFLNKFYGTNKEKAVTSTH